MFSMRSEIGIDLSIYRSLGSTVKIELNSPDNTSFICKVKDFLFEEDDTQVEFLPVEETQFPNDTKENKQESYIVFMKDIKIVEEVK